MLGGFAVECLALFSSHGGRSRGCRYGLLLVLVFDAGKRGLPHVFAAPHRRRVAGSPVQSQRGRGQKCRAMRAGNVPWKNQFANSMISNPYLLSEMPAVLCAVCCVLQETVQMTISTKSEIPGCPFAIPYLSRQLRSIVWHSTAKRCGCVAAPVRAIGGATTIRTGRRL